MKGYEREYTILKMDEKSEYTSVLEKEKVDRFGDLDIRIYLFKE
jgi:hypothetical protein